MMVRCSNPAGTVGCWWCLNSHLANQSGKLIGQCANALTSHQNIVLRQATVRKPSHPPFHPPLHHAYQPQPVRLRIRLSVLHNGTVHRSLSSCRHASFQTLANSVSADWGVFFNKCGDDTQRMFLEADCVGTDDLPADTLFV
jgi:hypothetical protein